MSDAAAFDVVCVPIGEYAYSGYPTLPADEQAERVAAILAELGGRAMPWAVTAADRNRINVNTFLSNWAKPDQARNSVVFWVGHGESAGQDAWLATRDTEDMSQTGVKPEDLASFIRGEWGRRRSGDGAWAIVVFEACGARRFAQRVVSLLMSDPDVPECLAVISSGGEGTAYLGDFQVALRKATGSFTDNDDCIQLYDLVLRIRSRLHEGDAHDLSLHLAEPFPRRRSLSGTVTAPVDIYAELQTVLADLSPDERGHFIPKAQGAEQGELAWYFVGRERERNRIAAWLRERNSGMLIVTGRAGSGKSALLGNVLVHTNPVLRGLLFKARRLDPLPADQRPPDHAFDAIVHLTGMSSDSLVRRLAEIAEVGAGEDVEALLGGLAERRFTVLVDALDEAQEPAAIASTVLRRIAALEQGRVVVGTRPSAREGPDQPDVADEDLLDALGRAGTTETVEVGRDPHALAAYVRLRLMAAPALDADDSAIDRVVELIGTQEREFLFARLAVHELLAQPDLLDPARPAELESLLCRDHQALFEVAVRRLARTAAAYPALLEALSVAQGRGLPRAHGVWAAVAAALTEIQITEEAIDDLLKAAAPYVMLDAEDGQSVYRLAHDTFRAYFLTRHSALADTHRRVAAALIASARENLPSLNKYLAHHLSGHVAAAGSWRDLIGSPEVFDHISPDHVCADALRTAFGRLDTPPEINAAITARPTLATTPPVDRSAVRALAVLRLGQQMAPNVVGGARWQPRWGNLLPEPPHAQLTGHTDGVVALATVPLPDRRVLLATGSMDQTIRLWDPDTGNLIGAPLKGHTAGVTALATVPLRGGRVLLASGSDDGTIRLWDPVTGMPLGEPLTGHVGSVNALAAVPMPGGRYLLATGGTDKLVRLWDPMTRQPEGEPLTGHAEAVTTLAAVLLPGERFLLASGSEDYTIRLWDPVTGTSDPLVGHRHWVQTIAVLQLPAGGVLLASGDAEGTVRLWDAATGQPTPVQLAEPSAVTTLAAVPLPAGQVLLASAGPDGTVRLWDPTSGVPAGEPLIGSGSGVYAVTALALPDGRVLLAGGGLDSVVRLWNAAPAEPMDRRRTGHVGGVSAVATVPQPEGHTLLATGGLDRLVRLWDSRSGDPAGEPLNGATGGSLTGERGRAAGHTGEVTAMATVSLPDGRTLLATGGTDNTVWLWDPGSGRAERDPLTGHTGTVTSLAAVQPTDGEILLASGSTDGTVRLWNLETGRAITRRLLRKLDWSHGVPVRAVAAMRLPSNGRWVCSGDSDGTVRLWDPDSGRAIGTIQTGHTDEIGALALLTLPDGRAILASGGREGTIQLWDPRSGERVGSPLTGHIHAVRALAVLVLSEGRTALVSGSDDGTVRLWDLEAQRPVGMMNLGIPVRALSVVGSALAVGSSTGVLVIDLKFGAGSV